MRCCAAHHDLDRESNLYNNYISDFTYNEWCICNLTTLIKMYYLHGIIWYDHSEWWIEMSVELAMAYFKAYLPEAAEGNLKLECSVHEARVLTIELQLLGLRAFI